MDFLDLGTYQPSYRSLVDLQVGDVGSGTATTTLQDTNVKVTWDLLFTLKYRTTQVTSWFTTLGTKCGTGNQAGGSSGCDLTVGNEVVFRGTVKLYGCKIRKRSAGSTRIQYLPGITGSTGELVDCDFQNQGTTNSYILGTSTQKVDNVFNCTFSVPTTTQPVFSNVFVTAMERVLIASESSTSYISTNAVDIGFKDTLFKGTVTAGDIRVNSGAARWSMVRPGWSQTAPAKVAFTTAHTITLANALKEYWLFNVKVVDSTGAGLANIPVKLTDTLSNVQVNTTTDTYGRISFGSGLTANAVLVVNHYGTSGVYAQSHRSPFLLEVNTGNDRDQTRQSLRTRFYWPGYETYTTTAGTFEDVNVIVPLETASGTPTTWTEHEMP